MQGRECKFVSVRIEDCQTYGLKIVNATNGAALNRFISCDFDRNGGGASAEANVVIPQNDVTGYANGSMFVGCWFDRFGDNVPCLDLGTSAHVAACWFQSRDYAGIKLRGSGSRLRITACSIDSTSSAHVLIDLAAGALPQYINMTSTVVDGQMQFNGNLYNARILDGGTEITALGSDLVRRFTTTAGVDRFDVGPVLRTAGSTPNITSGETYGDFQFFNLDNSGAGPNIAARIRAVSNTASGAGGRLVFSTSVGTEPESSVALDVVQIDSIGDLHPSTDGGSDLGTGLFKWQTVHANSYRVGGVAGASGSFTTTDGKTVTVTNGIIISIV